MHQFILLRYQKEQYIYIFVWDWEMEDGRWKFSKLALQRVMREIALKIVGGMDL